MSYKEIITNGIRRLRTENRLTQEQFAEKLVWVYKVTEILSIIDIYQLQKTIDKICEVFNIQPVELLLPEPQANLDKVRELINNKLCNCNLDKLIRINNMIDLM